VTAEQSALLPRPLLFRSSLMPRLGPELGGGTESAVTSEQEATLLDSPSGMSTESDEEPLSVSAAAGASGVAETAATDTPSFLHPLWCKTSQESRHPGRSFSES